MRPLPRLLLVALLLATGGLLGAASDRARPVPRSPGGMGTLLGGLAAVAAQVVWLRADAALDERRDAEALYYLDLVMDLEPRLVGAADQAAHAIGFNRAGEFTDPAARWSMVREGLRILDRAVERNPGSAAARTNRGTYLFARVAREEAMEERFEAERGAEPLAVAVQDLEEALRLSPDDGRTLERLGQAALALGQRRLLEEWRFDDAGGPLRRAAEVLRTVAGPEGDGSPLWETIHLTDDLAAVCATQPTERRRVYEETRLRWRDRVDLPDMPGD